MLSNTEKQGSAKAAFHSVAGAAADADPFAFAGRAPKTWRAYGTACSRFAEWCEEHNTASMPASVATLRAWIVHLVEEGHAVTTVQSYLAGVAVAHRFAGHPIDRRPLAETLRGMRRLAARPRQARPLLGDDLARILRTLNPASPADARDGALLALGWAGALRQGELSGLDLDRVGPDSDGVGFIAMKPAGIEIVLCVSKTSQAADVHIPVPHAVMPAAQEWLERWRAIAVLETGKPVFRSVGRSGRISTKRLSGPSIGAVVRERFIAALEAEGVSEIEAFQAAADVRGHSLRAGVISTMAAAGVPEHQIRARSRHRSANVAAGYVRLARDWTTTGLDEVGF